jgi:hypothetical protein
MPECPRCYHPVEAQAIACPACHLELKAHGHPGIPLYRADTGTYLCQTCLYDQDETCTFPQRPYATECTLYTNPATQSEPLTYRPSPARRIRFWINQNLGWLVLTSLIGISVWIAIANR